MDKSNLPEDRTHYILSVLLHPACFPAKPKYGSKEMIIITITYNCLYLNMQSIQRMTAVKSICGEV